MNYTNGFEHLFELELQYRKEMAAVTSSEGKVGKYIGSGDGKVKGSKIQGTVRWDIFEKQAEPVCDANFTGVIETNDGAQIQFHTLGFFQKDKSSSKWSLASGLQFDSSDERYKWLNPRLAILEGVFDMDTGSMRFTSRLTNS